MSDLPKLVRDKIPELIIADGDTPIWHYADASEVDRLLREKLIEEAIEYAESGDPDELVDVTDVIQAILYERGQAFNSVYFGSLIEKTRTAGAFFKHIVLERVDRSEPEQHSWDDVDDGLSVKPE